MHQHGVRDMLIRYPAAVICSYAAFFGLVKLWLISLIAFREEEQSR
jgi:hypothetical protein